MPRGRVILKGPRFDIMVERLCRELVENYGDFGDTCVVGIQPRGTMFAERICSHLKEITGLKPVHYGKLDITFYRDDFRRRESPLRGSSTKMDFLVEDKKVILVDDVLYSGRTVQAAMTAIQHYGRASQIELAVLIDRRFNRHLPIQPNYTGLVVDAVDEAYVKVEWQEVDGEDRIKLFSKQS